MHVMFECSSVIVCNVKSIVAASKTRYRFILDSFYLTLDAPLAIDSFSLTDVNLANFQ